MWEDEIDAAAMDVESLAEMLRRHRRALDVPTRTPAAPRALPSRLIRARRLPQHEIRGIALVGRDLDAGAGDHLVARAPRELAVVAHAGDGEKHVAVGEVSVLRRDQTLDHADHAGDVI